MSALGFAELCAQYPGWDFWERGNGLSVPRSWHATRATPDGTTIIAADSVAQLQRRLQQAESKTAAAG